jgi:hypothetical protein
LVSGFRLSADPLEDAILLGIEGAADEPLMVKRGDPEVTSMWFGPRLGRRDKRSLDEMLLDEVADNKVEEVLELLKDTPWALVPLKSRCILMQYKHGGPAQLYW